MEFLVDKENCCGCTACVNACPKQCIHMQEDAEGFKYPMINKNECINCGLCEKACPINSEEEHKKDVQPLAYACINLDDRVRLDSSSGGIFSLLAENIIDKGGIVYGAAFDKNGMVHHIGIEKKDDIRLLRGSKYIQSDMNHVFQDIKNQLENNRSVLFTGTPCQNAGLKSFLRKDCENLYCVDSICHGVPSPTVWKRYLAYLENKLGKERRRESNPSFRAKHEGWVRYSVSIPFSHDTEYRKEHHQDSFMKLFLKNIVLRPSCYHCHFKPSTNISDITLADFWGVWDIVPEMYDDKGTSLSIVNSEKGKKLFDEIKGNMKYQAVDLQEAIHYNSSFYQSVKKPKGRKYFFEQVDKCDLEKLMDTTARDSLLVKGKVILRKVLIAVRILKL